MTFKKFLELLGADLISGYIEEELPMKVIARFPATAETLGVSGVLFDYEAGFVYLDIVEAAENE